MLLKPLAPIIKLNDKYEWCLLYPISCISSQSTHFLPSAPLHTITPVNPIRSTLSQSTHFISSAPLYPIALPLHPIRCISSLSTHCRPIPISLYHPAALQRLRPLADGLRFRGFIHDGSLGRHASLQRRRQAYQRQRAEQNAPPSHESSWAHPTSRFSVGSHFSFRL